MDKGRIIYLNGVTSSGKTSIVEALQARSIDGILVEREGVAPHYERMREILRNNPLDIVEVFCPLELCRQRNIDRGDRDRMQSDEQAKLMAKEICYSLHLDTGRLSPEECADVILRDLF